MPCVRSYTPSPELGNLITKYKIYLQVSKLSSIKAKLNERGVRGHFLTPNPDEKSVSVRSKSDESCHLLSDKIVNTPSSDVGGQ